jgi:hypothetical protein
MQWAKNHLTLLSLYKCKVQTALQYLDNDIDVSGEKADEDGKLELGEDQLSSDPDARAQLQRLASPPA